MKPLFFSLCLLNLLVLAWETHKHSESPAINTQYQPPMILTLAEFENAQHDRQVLPSPDQDLQKPEASPPQLAQNPPETSASPAPQPEPTLTSYCYEFGPFADRQEATDWLAALARPGKLIERQTALPSTYLVYFPADKNSEQLRIHKMLLKAKGISDFWMINNGELKGALSLGLFNDEKHAETFKVHLGQLGIAAQIQPRYKQQIVIFVRLQSQQAIQQTLAGRKSQQCTQSE